MEDLSIRTRGLRTNLLRTRSCNVEVKDLGWRQSSKHSDAPKHPSELRWLVHIASTLLGLCEQTKRFHDGDLRECYSLGFHSLVEVLEVGIHLEGIAIVRQQRPSNSKQWLSLWEILWNYKITWGKKVYKNLITLSVQNF